MLPKMTPIECVEKTLSQLADKKERAAQRLREIEQERAQIAYAAHAEGDAKAIKRLEQLAHDAAGIAGEVSSVDTAIAEAHRRLDGAKAGEAREAARANAAEIKALLTVFAETARDMDEALADFATSSHELRDVVNKLHNLGCQFPNHNQIESLGSRAVLTAIGQSIFKRAVETLAPGERRSFAPMVATWIANIENTHIKPLLGEQTRGNSRCRAKGGKRKARVLTNLKIDVTSAVDAGAGEGVKIVMMKRDRAALERGEPVFEPPVDDDESGDSDEINDTSGEPTRHLNDLVEQLEQKEKERAMKSKSLDVVKVCKAMAADGDAYGTSEHELVDWLDRYAKAHDTTFVALYERNDDVGLAIRKAVTIAKTAQFLSRTSAMSKEQPQFSNRSSEHFHVLRRCRWSSGQARRGEPVAAR